MHYFIHLDLVDLVSSTPCLKLFCFMADPFSFRIESFEMWFLFGINFSLWSAIDEAFFFAFALPLQEPSGVEVLGGENSCPGA